MSTATDALKTFGQEALARFARKNPLAMTVRLALEYVFAAAALTTVFEACRIETYTLTLPFPLLVDILGAVVLGQAASVHVALQKLGDRLPVSVAAAYGKLNRVEPRVAAGLVHHTAGRAREVIDGAHGACVPRLPGRRVRILDGNHLAATERRLDVLWGCVAGPLPGFCLVVLDPVYRLFTDVIPCEDGHTQERALTDQILALVQAADCWIADRNFCTLAILFGVLTRHADFVIRQHGNLPYRLLGARVACGRVPGGRVFEQAVELTYGEATRTLRRITVALDQPTRDGEHAIHILTSLPVDLAAAPAVATLYQGRWTIETAFAELARWLEAELAPLGYPQAALFAFCLGLAAYNALAVVLGALRAVHGERVVAEEVSGYQIIAQTRNEVVGVDAILDDADWAPLRRLTALQIAAELVRLAQAVPLARIRKAKRGPKKPVPRRTRFKGKGHVSTQRLLKAKASGGP